MSKIRTNLYLGSANNVKSIVKNPDSDGFTIFSCAKESLTKHDYKIGMYDGYNKNISTIFDEAVDYIKQNLDENKKLFVHCMAGISRSASVIIYYLMKYEGYTYEDAYTEVKDLRPVIKPNRFFEKHLRAVEKGIVCSSSDESSSIDDPICNLDKPCDLDKPDCPKVDKLIDPI
jgi:protein-tyrosine phosphatase